MNYGELKAALKTFMRRNDLDSEIPVYVSLAQARLGRELRIRELMKETTLIVTAGSERVSLPADFASVASTTSDGATTDYVPADRLIEDGTASIVNSALILHGAVEADTNIALTYFAAPSAFVSDADTDALLTRWPDIYLFATLVESGNGTFGDERALMFQQRYEAAKSQAVAADSFARFPNAALPGVN